jgi:hypothetical protein
MTTFVGGHRGRLIWTVLVVTLAATLWWLITDVNASIHSASVANRMNAAIEEEVISGVAHQKSCTSRSSLDHRATAWAT